MKKLSGPSW